MMTDKTEAAETEVRELTVQEVDGVSGGLLPALILAFAVGFDIGFVGVCAFGPTGFKG